MNHRTPDYPIDPLILNRWSPRAMAKEPISEQELRSLFEAARWAPSSSNSQPWVFLYAKNGSNHWETFFNLLVPFNQLWCKNAAVLGVISSLKISPKTGKKLETHSFDTGAAWENLALQGSALGLVTHGMQGFDYELARKSLHIPDTYQVEAMFAVGKKGSIDALPEDLQKREAPSQRKKIEEFVFEGPFRKENRANP